jgi:PAS domain S-box-containing protein
LRQKYRFAACLAVLIALLLVVAFVPLPLPMLFSIPLALLVVSLVCEVEGAALGLLITEIIFTGVISYGGGLTALPHLALGPQLFFSQVLLVTMTLVMLPAAAATTERRKLHDGLVDALQREAYIALALRESEQRYRLMAENASDIVLQTDPHGIIVYISPSAKRLTGYEPHELIGQHSEKYVLVEDKNLVHEAKEKMRNGALNVAVTCRLLHSDGSIRWFESRPTVLFDEAGKPAGLLSIVRDITERKAMQDELVRSHEQAEAAVVAKSEFLANMSHELRTPLTSVIGFADLLYEHDTLDDRAKRYADRVRSGGRSLLATINDILDYSTLESEKFILSPASIQPAEIAEEVIALLSIQAQDKGIRLYFSYAPSLLESHIWADPQRIRQLLLNLVGNAIKFTDTGSVKLFLEYVEKSDCYTTRSLRCEVTDTGSGISHDQQRRLFQRFSQLDGSNTRQHGGTGLGLAICKGITAAMGGEIGVSSVVDQGSTFWFEIPAAMAEPQLPVQKKKHLPDRTGPKRVLVVDDNEANRAYVRLAMGVLDVDVVEADSGEQSIGLVAQQKFDVILMDIRMPGMGGTAAMRAIRAAYPEMVCPIIAFSGDGDAAQSNELLTLGFSAVLKKPITVSDLRSCVLKANADEFSVIHEGKKNVA